LELTVLFKIILIFILLCFSAFFSGSETALFSLGSIKLFKLKESRHPRASLLDELLKHPRRLIISLLVGNDIINITMSAVAASLFISVAGIEGSWLSIAVMTPIIYLFGEVLPKTIAVTHSEAVAALVARPVDFFARLIFPLRWIFKKMVDAILYTLGAAQEKKETLFYEKEFKDLVDTGHREGVLEQEEYAIIHKILKFNDTVVSSIMTPRSKMFILSDDLPLDQAIARVKEQHFSRVPVYSRSKNGFSGILNAKDLIAITAKGNLAGTALADIIRPPHCTPSDKRIQVLLKEFQAGKIHLGLVVDAAGQCIGLVTMEDMLEELFGEIYDEFD
jgi:putative hemolysin